MPVKRTENPCVGGSIPPLGTTTPVRKSDIYMKGPLSEAAFFMSQGLRYNFIDLQ
jgi:hypothetical protein